MHQNALPPEKSHAANRTFPEPPLPKGLNLLLSPFGSARHAGHVEHS